ADLAQPAVALAGFRAEIAGDPRDAAVRGRVPPRPQSGQPARSSRFAVASRVGVPANEFAGCPGFARRGRHMEESIMNEGIREAEDVLSIAGQWRAAGEDVALATVTETWGSSPRPAGSQMAVTASGRMAGSVSGGCIEGAVADAAMNTIRTGTPQMLDFGVSNERAWEVGLACGGKV